MTANHQSEGALSTLRVLDLGGMRASYTGKLMADLGADVILVEPPAGDVARRLPPYAGDGQDPERSIVFLAFQTNKRSVVLDLTTPEGRDNLLKLARTADVLLEGYQPGYLASLGLDVETLQAENPRLVVCSVTPYGQTGPYVEAGYKGGALQAEAMSGLMTLQGDPTKAPCMSPAFLGYSLPGIQAAIGVMHALFAREESGRGQHVDVSMQEAIAHVLFIVSQYGYNATIAQRPGAGAGGGTGMFACKDGWVGFSPIFPNQFKALADWMENPVLQDPTFSDLRVRTENSEFINQMVSEFIAQFTVQEFVEEAQKRRIPTAPVSTARGLANNPHLLERDYFQEVEHPVVGTYAMPGAFARLSETPWRISRPAPRLGEHTQEVLAAAGGAQKPQQQDIVTATARSRSANGRARLPLEGVRVTDLTRVWVGPYGTRHLADFGAQVIKIESSLFDAASRAVGLLPMHPELNRNKLSVTVDLHHKEGQDLVKQLVRVSDAVTENYAAGALKRWGLDYESLRQVKPDIVYVSMPGWGSTGPYASHVLFGLQAQTASGVTYLWGYPDSPPSLRCGVYYADYFVGAQSAFALEAALLYRKRTGKGQYIEISQVEAQANALGVPLLDYFLNGVDEEPQGNARDFAAPFGVYSCVGSDAWCAISCNNEQEWQGFVRAITPPGMPAPAWTQEPEFADRASRVANRAELDERVSDWTRTLTPKQVMAILQRHGVPASAVYTTEDVYFDAQLNARGFITQVQHSDAQWGRFGHAAFAARLSETPGAIQRGAPALGEHNQMVLTELLGLSDSQVKDLVEAKVLV